MGKVIVTVSGKGGTGKTTFCACLAGALAKNGYSVLVVDADVGMRNTDIALGMSDRLLFSFSDVVNGYAELGDAAKPHPKIDGLYVLTAPYEAATADDYGPLAGLFSDFRKSYDYTLIDCPAGTSDGMTALCAAADKAVVVVTSDLASLRGAVTMAGRIRESGQKDCRMVVNRVRARMISRGRAVNIDHAMNETGLPLLGVIPEDENLIYLFNAGRLPELEKPTGARQAIINIAERIEGKRVRLFRNIPRRFLK